MLSQPANFVFLANPVVAGSGRVSLDVNNIAMGAPGDDVGMAYACVFDRVLDGAVTLPLSCAVPGGATFDTGLGALEWSPPVDAYGPFEFAITGTKGAASDTVIVHLDVRQPYLLTMGGTRTLLADYDAQFVTPEGPPMAPAPALPNLSGSGDATLLGSAATGFAGSTLPGDPHHVHLDGAGHIEAPQVLGGRTSGVIQMWMAPDPDAPAGTTVLATDGLDIRQSSALKGALDVWTAQRPSLDTTRWPDLGPDGRDAVMVSFASNPFTGTGTAGDPWRVTFDGSDDHAYANARKTGLLDEVTLESWAYFAQASQNSSNDVVMHAGSYNATHDSAYIARARSGTNADKFFYTRNDVQLYGPVLPGQQWLHLVAIYKRTAPYVTLFVNGVEQTVAQPSGPLDIDRDSVGIGSLWDTLTHPHRGSIALARMWTRALKPAEVLFQFNARAPQFGILPIAGDTTQPDVSKVAVNYDAAILRSPCITDPLLPGTWAMLGARRASSSVDVLLGPSFACRLSAPSTSISAGAPIVVGDGWHGSVAHLLVYDAISQLDMARNFRSTVPRYTGTRFAAVDTDELVLELDAERAYAGVAPQAAGCAGRHWADLSSAARNVQLRPDNFDCAAGGWSTAPAALALDDGQNRVVVPHSVELDPAEMTVEMWLYADVATNWEAFMVKTPAAWNAGWGLVTTSNSTCTLGSGCTVEFFAGSWLSGAAMDFSIRAWTHIVGTLKNNTTTIYRNGVFQNSDTNASYAPTTLDVIVGDDPGNKSFNGKIGYAAIYGRALDPVEVESNCNALARRFGVSCDGHR